MLTESVPLPRQPLPKRLLHNSVARFSRWYWNRFLAHNRTIDGRLDRLLRRAARFYAHYELPNHVQFLEALLVNRPGLWQKAGRARCRGVWHGYTLELDLTDFYQRWAYFLGRYHEVPLQLLLRRALRRGDTFIDGGANVGFISLIAAWLVGTQGRVISFEPNQPIFDHLQLHISLNHLSQITPIRAGLSDEEAELEIRIPGKGNLAAGTFAPIPDRYRGVVSGACTAPIKRGDSIPEIEAAPGELILKLDVEGFECRAIKGFERTISRRHPLIITEVNREMLSQAGSSVQEMVALMHSHGYRGHGIASERVIIRHRRPVLTEVKDWASPPPDVCWIRPGSSHAARLTPFIRCEPFTTHESLTQHEPITQHTPLSAHEPSVKDEPRSGESILQGASAPG